jgi:NAD-dependent dihydropyrimidine dehydrogenase PreA subunit
MPPIWRALLAIHDRGSSANDSRIQPEAPMNTIIVNNELCNGCKICFKACFIDVIKWDATTKRPVIAYPEECVQCMFCELTCTQRALKVHPKYDSYMFPRENLA